MTSMCECIADIAAESPQQLRVVFASLDGERVDQHFGSAQAFFVYAVDACQATLLTSTHFGYEKNDGDENKLKPKLTWLAGGDIVYCSAIGVSATKQLISLGITPIKVPVGVGVETLLSDIKSQLQNGAEFWLANIIKKKSKSANDANRFDIDEAEDWG